MTVGEAGGRREGLPAPVVETLDEFQNHFGVRIHLRVTADGREGALLYPEPVEQGVETSPSGRTEVRTFAPKDGPDLVLEVAGERSDLGSVADLVLDVVSRTYDFAQEVRFFTFELSERYEEINLLYSISETLGSILRLDDAARVILGEVADVLGARRGSLWVYEPERDVLSLTASVGEEGLGGPIDPSSPDVVTARVFRDGRPLITRRENDPEGHSFLSVPIRYTPPAAESRTVGVINLIGRRYGGRFTASDQKLFSAIASQVGAALENNRLIHESLAQERVAREMELAHNLQMKLLPSASRFENAQVAARVEPADSVGGDFYHLFRLPRGRSGVMVGDVSSHGFPAALIMALSMSAASIYASEFASPGRVLGHIDRALRDELESTEMYLTLFYGVLDPGRQTLVYSNAGHPHAFVLDAEGCGTRLGATDPPVGFAGPEPFDEVEIDFGADDLLFLFTDGLADVLGTRETLSGERRLLEALAAHPGKSPAELVDILFSLVPEQTSEVPPDDRTALLLRV